MKISLKTGRRDFTKVNIDEVLAFTVQFYGLDFDYTKPILKCWHYKTSI
jgi:hypothetical protein